MGNVIGVRSLLAAVLGLGLIGSLVLGGGRDASGAANAAASAPREPKVVCVTSYSPPRGVYRYKPGKCEFHHRGDYPVSGANTAAFKSLNWKRWGGRKASGKGKIVLNMVGPVSARVQLTKKREVCGLHGVHEAARHLQGPELGRGRPQHVQLPDHQLSALSLVSPGSAGDVG